VTLDAWRPERVPRRSLRVAVRNVQGTVHLSLDDNEALALSESAAVVWRLLDGNRDATEIAEVLTEQFSVDAARALQDVCSLLEDFASRGIIQD